jgi:hypothetical protein
VSAIGEIGVVSQYQNIENSFTTQVVVSYIYSNCALSPQCPKKLFLVIEVEDYQRALGWLTEAEAYMPDIFKDMANGGDSAAIDDCWHYVFSSTCVRRNRSQSIVSYSFSKIAYPPTPFCACWI